MATLLDSYSETNVDGYQLVRVGGTNRSKFSQSFVGNGQNIDTVKFYLKKTGSPTTNAYAEIYAHTGTYGTSSVPTGSALVVSEPFDVSTLTTTAGLKTFTFSSPYTLANGTNYCLVFDFQDGDDSNLVQLGRDATSPTHGGNAAYWDGSTWTALSTTDECFYVYTVTVGSGSIGLYSQGTAPSAVGTLHDDFNDNSIDGTKWISSAGVAESSERLNFTTELTPSEPQVESAGLFSLTGSSISIELINAGNQSLASLLVYPLSLLKYGGDPGTLSFFITGGTIYAMKSEFSDTELASATYNSTTHRWLRIRESGGTFYWDYSSDSQSWSNLASSAGPDMTACSVFMTIQNEETEASTTVMSIDNLNVFNAVGTAKLYTTGALSGSGQVGVYTVGNNAGSGSLLMYTTGSATGSGEVGVYSSGFLLSSSSGEIGIYSSGLSSSSGAIGLYTYALLGGTGEIGLYTKGSRAQSGSGNFIDTEGSSSTWNDTKVSSSDLNDAIGASSDVGDLTSPSATFVGTTGESSSFTDT